MADPTGGVPRWAFAQGWGRALQRRVVGELRPRVLPRLVALAEPVIREVLDGRRQALLLARVEVSRLRAPLRATERRVERAAALFDRRPLGPALTIHAAHARDARVQQVFARHGLPDCSSCPVGADETLAEAAFAEGFDVEQVIDALRGLGL